MSAAPASPIDPNRGPAVHAGPGAVLEDAFRQPLHLAIGMFDGVHLGHQGVIRQAIAAARREPGHVAGVLTFDPHPSRILHPERATSLLMPLVQRIHKIQAAGVGFVYVQAFTRAYAQQKASEFVPGLARVFPQLSSIHVGANFRFGAGRSGDIATLGETAADCGIALHVLPRENLDGLAISSSRIRLALLEGSLHEVNAMLGHPYLIEGRVQPGKGLGRQLDYPTLNLAWMPEVLPRFGVYRVMLQGPGMDRPALGVANYGVRPTVDKATEPLLEVHVLDAGHIPSQGDWIKVALLDFIRPEMTFPSVQALHQQITRDVAGAREACQREGDLTPLPF